MQEFSSKHDVKYLSLMILENCLFILILPTLTLVSHTIRILCGAWFYFRHPEQKQNQGWEVPPSALSKSGSWDGGVEGSYPQNIPEATNWEGEPGAVLPQIVVSVL